MSTDHLVIIGVLVSLLAPIFTAVFVLWRYKGNKTPKHLMGTAWLVWALAIALGIASNWAAAARLTDENSASWATMWFTWSLFGLISLVAMWWIPRLYGTKPTTS